MGMEGSARLPESEACGLCNFRSILHNRRARPSRPNSLNLKLLRPILLLCLHISSNSREPCTGFRELKALTLFQQRGIVSNGRPIG